MTMKIQYVFVRTTKSYAVYKAKGYIANIYIPLEVYNKNPHKDFEVDFPFFE
jgi:hypothetical protein